MWCAAIVSLFNVADTISDGEVQLRLRNQYGEVLRVWPHPGMRGCRLVEFFDTRVAAAVRLLYGLLSGLLRALTQACRSGGGCGPFLACR